MPFATLIPPAPLSFVSIGRELLAGSAVPPAATIRVDGDAYDLEDTPTFIPDNGIRAVLAGLWGETLGPLDATFAFGGPAYLTADCYLYDNLFGDLSTVSNGTLGTAQTLAAPIGIGDTALYATSSVGAVTTGSVIQIADGAASEIVIATPGSTGTSVFFANTPCRFAHTTLSATAALQTAAGSYTHTFAVLNTGSGQPPSHTLTDYSGLTAGTGARYYPLASVSSLELSGDPEGLLGFKVTGNSWISVPATAAPSAGTPGPAPLANWRTTVTVGGTQIYTTGAWNAAFTRPLLGYWGANAQVPSYFARGDLTVTGALDYTVPQDETPLLQMTSGVPTTLAIAATNGQPGAAQQSMTLTMSQVQFLTAKLGRGGAVLDYADTFAALTNLTNAGGSGGAGPATLTVTNNIPTF